MTISPTTAGARLPSPWEMSCPHCHGAGAIPDEQLSPNFRLSEFIDSATARKLGITNVPTPPELAHLHELAAKLLQPLRDRFGPLRVTSGLRAPALNAAIGGASRSAHLMGTAADIIPVRVTVTEVMAYLATGALPFDQAIDEGHLHIAYRSPDWTHRRQLLVKRDGRYEPWAREVA